MPSKTLRITFGTCMTLKPSPRDDQIADLAVLIKLRKHGLWHDPGGGKTPTAALYTYWAWASQGEKSVWIQPTSIMAKNMNEIVRFSHFNPEDVVMVRGTPKQREKIMQSDAKCFLFTFAGFSNEWEKLYKYQPKIKNQVIDEFHLGYSGHTSQRTQSWYASTRSCNGLVPMTGTVIKGKLSSAYPILHVLNPTYYGHYGAFLNSHAVKDDWGSIIGWKNHERLGKILAAVGTRRSFESIFGKEAKVIQIEKCEMHDKQRAAYTELETLGALELEDEILKPQHKAVSVLRLRQIMAHPETMGLLKEGEQTGKDGQLWIHIENHVESGEQLAIFSAQVPEQERIYKQMQAKGLRVALINGHVSGSQRQKIDEDFRAGRLQFVVGSPATMAVGFNWGMLNTIIFVSLDYGDDSFVQAYRRAIRGKRDRPLLILVLEYENSIDQRIFDVVQAKSRDANLIDSTKEEIILSDHQEITDWLKKGLIK